MNDEQKEEFCGCCGVSQILHNSSAGGKIRLCNNCYSELYGETNGYVREKDVLKKKTYSQLINSLLELISLLDTKYTICRTDGKLMSLHDIITIRNIFIHINGILKNIEDI